MQHDYMTFLCSEELIWTLCLLFRMRDPLETCERLGEPSFSYFCFLSFFLYK